ncbi:hypothetical protein AN958_02976 [Leucoagaricus sp. SymC.cos]|nr:hypothetical protein AN958_02976 [Leucoagaricus sp. SymC.cos]
MLYAPSAPAQNVIAYKAISFTEAKDLVYEQEPSPRVDVAWRSLYDFSGSTLPGYNRTPSFNETLEFVKQQGTKIRLLDVFHELHCLDTIRRALYLHQYPEPVDSDHVIHCINSIRQSLMCMSDVSLVSWEWNNELGALVESDGNVHTCRDFEKIQQWASENHFDRQFVGAPAPQPPTRPDPPLQ